MAADEVEDVLLIANASIRFHAKHLGIIFGSVRADRHCRANILLHFLKKCLGGVLFKMQPRHLCFNW